jgi:hypothetical protein
MFKTYFIYSSVFAINSSIFSFPKIYHPWRDSISLLPSPRWQSETKALDQAARQGDCTLATSCRSLLFVFYSTGFLAGQGDEHEVSEGGGVHVEVSGVQNIFGDLGPML